MKYWLYLSNVCTFWFWVPRYESRYGESSFYVMLRKDYDIVYTIKYGKNNPKLSWFVFEGPSCMRQQIRLFSPCKYRHNA